MRASPKSEPATNRMTDTHVAARLAHEHDQRVAARVVASRATGVEDCSELLGMLGLARVVGLPVVDPPPVR